MTVAEQSRKPHASPTERLYYDDPYLQTFEASVVDRAEGGRRIYLDRTAFYPTSGGQPFDTGRLDAAAVIDVIDEGERIAHLLETPLDADRVTGVIDWPRRFDHMQQHTGQHLLSAVLADLFGFATTSVHFGSDESTLDLDSASISADQVTEAERRANRNVSEDRSVTVSFEAAESAAGLRKASERAGLLRVVTIKDLDRSACGGTHVRATGEIGTILIRGVERVRQAVRLTFLCGERAVRRARREHDLLVHAAGVLSSTPDELPSQLERRQRQLKDTTAALRSAEQELAAYRARELYEAARPDQSGVRHVVVRNAESQSMERLRALGQAVAALPRVVFVGSTLEPPTLLLATSEDSGLDAGRALKPLLGLCGGRGGGNSRLAQGTVTDQEALEQVIEGLLPHG